MRCRVGNEIVKVQIRAHALQDRDVGEGFPPAALLFEGVRDQRCAAGRTACGDLAVDKLGHLVGQPHRHLDAHDAMVAGCHAVRTTHCHACVIDGRTVALVSSA